jgi:hypothetical protein
MHSDNLLAQEMHDPDKAFMLHTSGPPGGCRACPTTLFCHEGTGLRSCRGGALFFERLQTGGVSGPSMVLLNTVPHKMLSSTLPRSALYLSLLEPHEPSPCTQAQSSKCFLLHKRLWVASFHPKCTVIIPETREPSAGQCTRRPPRSRRRWAPTVCAWAVATRTLST